MQFTATETHKMQSLTQLSFYSRVFRVNYFSKNDGFAQLVTNWIVWNLHLS